MSDVTVHQTKCDCCGQSQQLLGAMPHMHRDSINFNPTSYLPRSGSFV